MEEAAVFLQTDGHKGKIKTNTKRNFQKRKIEKKKASNSEKRRIKQSSGFGRHDWSFMPAY